MKGGLFLKEQICGTNKSKYAEKVSLYILILNIILTLIKFIVGIVGNSFALVADAFHSLTDAVTTIAVIISLRISRRPPDFEHPYGHGKVESVVAKIISLLLILIGIFMLGASINKIMVGEFLIPEKIAIWAAAVSILVKEFSYQYTIHAAKKIGSTLLATDAWHHRSDAISSIAALIGIVGAILGYPVLDPLMAAGVSLFIIWAGYGLLRESIDELMDSIPDTQLPDKIKELCQNIEGVKNARNIKIRKYGMFLVVDLVIVVDPYMTVDEGHHLSTLSRSEIIETYDNIIDVFIHVSPNESRKEELS